MRKLSSTKEPYDESMGIRSLSLLIDSRTKLAAGTNRILKATQTQFKAYGITPYRTDLDR
jgi:hypothetical protein